MPWDGKYDPVEMLEVTKVSCFENEFISSSLDNCVTSILSTIIVSKTNEELLTNLKKILTTYGVVSIGRCLSRLHNIATDEPFLRYGRSGLDALSYHLSANNCKQGIAALQKVLDHF